MEDTHPFPSLQRAGAPVFATTPCYPRHPQKTRIQQLRDLEKDGVVNRKICPEVPPKMEYMLIEDGVALRPALRALKSWATSRKTDPIKN
jgi:DNA-binding HxlR family transcriptional regulator